MGTSLPRVALRYNPTRAISAYISYSQGFRASILDDLCRSGWMWVGPKIANPELGPEQIDNYEIGGTFRLTKNLSFSPSLYYAKGKDFLYYVTTGEKMWGKRDIFQRQNVSKVDVKGIEADLNYIPFNGLKINLNYSYNNPKVKDFKEKPELNNKILTYAPKNQIKGYVLWTGGIADVMFRGRYKSKQYTTEDNSAAIDGFTIWVHRYQMVFRPPALCRWGNHQYVRQQIHEHQRLYVRRSFNEYQSGC